MKVRFRDKKLPDSAIPKKMLPGRTKLRRYRIAFVLSVVANIAAAYHIYFNNL
jgi:hypothetical protein